MNILYIILKHVVWRFRIYNYFREIVKFRDFTNIKKFREICFAHTFTKFEYFEKVIIYSDSQTMCFKMIYNDAIHQLDKLNSFPTIAFELVSSMARALGF